MRKLQDLTGHRFGKLLVLRKSERLYHWICKCDCGNESEAYASNLIHGRSQSCKCSFKTRGGLMLTAIGRIWGQIIRRCFDQKCKAFKNYGARGIAPCEFIKASPLNLALVMGHRPSDDLTLDRTNNDLGYNCGQCAQCVTNEWILNMRWATATQQGRNRRGNIHLTFNNQRKTVVEWCEITGIPRTTFDRKRRNGNFNPIAI